MQRCRQSWTAVMVATLSVGVANTVIAQDRPDASSYRVVRTRVVDSGGLGTLALDPGTRTLYGAGSTVIAIDRDSILDEMPDGVGHGFAFADDRGRGVTRRGAIFDLHTHALLRPGAKASAFGVAYDRATGRAAVNFDTLLVMDVGNGGVAGVLPIGASQSVASDDEGHFFVDLNTDTLVVIDARRLTILHRWALSSCQSPSGMEIDRRNRRLFVSCGNRRVVVLNSTSGAPVATIDGPGSAAQLAFDGKAHLLFVPTENDTLTIIKEDTPDRYHVVANVDVGPIRSAVAVDESSHAVFLVHRGCRSPDDPTICLITMAPSSADAAH
jgi:hypothetical protein